MRHLSIAICALCAVSLAACGAPVPSPSAANAAASYAGRQSEPPKTLSIGSFDSTRGGAESLEASSVSGLNAAIVAMFHPKFHYTAKLTAPFLRKVNVMVIGVAATVSGGEIKPLSRAEQRALVAFVKNGGAVAIFADNKDFQKADNSLLKPFGLASTGKLNGSQIATWVGNVSQNPLATGPAGSAAELDTFYPGWFSKLGSATDLADLPGSGPPAAAYFPAGTLGAHSGAAVFFADSSLMLDGTRTTNDQIAILNALALAP